MPSKFFGNRHGVRAHLTRGKRGISGEVADLRSDVDAAMGALEEELGVDDDRFGADLVEVTTTTDDAEQVLASYPVPANGILSLEVMTTGNKAGTVDGVTARLSGSFKRNGAAGPVRIGDDDVTIKKTAGLAIDSTTGLALLINGNAVQVVASPGEAVTLNWTVALQGLGGPAT